MEGSRPISQSLHPSLSMKNMSKADRIQIFPQSNKSEEILDKIYNTLNSPTNRRDSRTNKAYIAS